MKIQFKHIKGTRYYEVVTEGENTIMYNFVHEDKLKYYNPSGDEIEPTRMVLEANFDITAPMLDLLESSKIAYVLGKKFDPELSYAKVTYFPRPGFSYEKMQDVIVDIYEKFNLF